MTDLNWCTYCDSAILSNSESLYCSEKCLKLDALHHHPLLGYKYPEYQYFFKKINKQEPEKTTSVQLYDPRTRSCKLYKQPTMRELLH